MIFGTNTTRDISKLSQISLLTAREITFNNFEISLVVYMPNITTKDNESQSSIISYPSCSKRISLLIFQVFIQVEKRIEENVRHLAVL